MPLQTNQFYEFGDFSLDLSEKVLLHEGSAVPLTPKVFDTLKLLVENAGHLLDKEELIQTIWPDRFVEEGNLTFNIKMLRKALGDAAAEPRFIETVPRRGYRFIAEVREISRENGPRVTSLSSAPPFGRPSADYHKPKAILLSASSVLIIGAALFGYWFARDRDFRAAIPVLSEPFGAEKLSTNGKVTHAIISSDGKNVLYTNGIGNEKESVWLRQLESSNNVQIIPPSDDVYAGLALSPDGNFLYFSRRPRGFEGQADIYRVSIPGGIPVKILSETQGWISISPDGSRISFVRCYYRDDEFCSLWIADAGDGKNGRMLASRPRPFRIADNEISPDGKSVAFAVGQSENQANDFSLMEVDIETGSERSLTPEKFFNIKSLAWLPGRNGVLLTASRIPTKNFRIWGVSAAGEVRPLTKDSETYSGLSLDREARRLVTTQVRQDLRLGLFATDNPAARRTLADAVSLTFSRRGKLVFSSTTSGNDEIWSINADGSGQKQLTNDPADDSRPIVSSDDKSIFFVSNRTGEAQVWRISADGSNPTQITYGNGGFPLFVSPDGKWLYYQHGVNRTLWRVPADGGNEELVLDKRKYQFEFSPDGLLVAFAETQMNEQVLMIVSLADGQTFKTFRLPDSKASLSEIDWLRDGKSIGYTLTGGDYADNILWLQPLDGSTPRQIANLGSEFISELRFSPDGKNFAVTGGAWRHDAVLITGLR